MVTGGLRRSLGAQGGPPGFPALNDLWNPKGHGFLRGGRLSPEVGLRCPENPRLRGQTPGEGPFHRCPRVGLGPRSPAGRICQLCGELRFGMEVKTHGRVSMGFRVGCWGSKKVVWELRGPSLFSCPERFGAPEGARLPAGWQAESGSGAQVSPFPRAVVPGPWGGALGGRPKVRVWP